MEIEKIEKMQEDIKYILGDLYILKTRMMDDFTESTINGLYMYYLGIQSILQEIAKEEKEED